MLDARCPTGKTVVGGGFTFGEMDRVDTKVYQSYPATSTSWRVAIDDDGTPTQLTAYAVCVSAT